MANLKIIVDVFGPWPRARLPANGDFEDEDDDEHEYDFVER
jgi:hypothetical protein